MPVQSRLTTPGNGLCLLAIDAGGTRAISQLKILAELMHRINYDLKEEEMQRPCDVFDMIGGTGSGGFIAILLVVSRLTADQALEEFADLSVNILDAVGMNAEARTAAFEKYINVLLDRYEVGRGRRLLDSINDPVSCKLVVPISYKQNVRTPCVLRNFETRQEQVANMTVAQALLATLAMPPLFSAISLAKDASTFEYIREDLTLSNPVREVISEAYTAFGPKQQVACLLSVGFGHAGVIGAPEGSDIALWNAALEKLVTDSEQKAHEIDVQIGHLGLYHRFCVNRGLERTADGTALKPGDILTYTTTYLSDVAISRKMDLCLDSLKLRNGLVFLEQLKHAGGETLPPTPLPPLTTTFVMRKESLDFIERAMLGTEGIKGPRMLAVTGIGGCGKTQLILKFMKVHKSKFTSLLFIDGSSASRIRAGVIQRVRSLGPKHSQKTFEECLLFLSHPTSKGLLLVYDNVDDPDPNLLPLPDGEGCSIIITSRNRSAGDICPGSHLELDKMEMEEAMELLLYPRGRTEPVTEEVRRDAHALAEALGRLPIALQQARSYMFQTGYSAQEYLDGFHIHREKLLRHPLKYQRAMKDLSTYAAFEASFGRLDLCAQKLLKLLSFLYWSKFPLELIILAAKHGFSNYQYQYTQHGDGFYTGKALLEEIFFIEDEWATTHLDDLISSLQNYSFVTLVLGVETRLLETHTLFHEWVRSSVLEEDQRRYQCAAVLLLALGDREDHTPSAQYLASHVTHLSFLWSRLSINDAAAFGRIMRNAGLLKDALVLEKKAVADFQNCSDPSTRNQLGPQWELARTYLAAGQLQDAETIQAEILKHYKKTLGTRHMTTVMASNNLAVTYYSLGRLQEAKFHQEEILRLRKEFLGERHPDTIMASNNLACTYRDLGRLEAGGGEGASRGGTKTPEGDPGETPS